MGTYRPRKWKYKYEPYFTSGSKFNSWEEYVEWNEQQECSNPACTKKRYRRGKFCAMCGKYCTAFGDPRWRRIKFKHYKPQTDLAVELIAYNMTNVVVVDFVERFLGIIDDAKHDRPVEWSKWLKCMDSDIDAHFILARFVGINILSMETHNDVIKSDKMFHYALADIALRGIKSKVRPPASTKRMHRFGRFLWDLFAVSWLKLARGAIKNERMKAMRKQELEQAVIQLPESRRLEGKD
jgi:hypothetical protein